VILASCMRSAYEPDSVRVGFVTEFVTEFVTDLASVGFLAKAATHTLGQELPVGVAIQFQY
jgi:hypothetical protein